MVGRRELAEKIDLIVGKELMMRHLERPIKSEFEQDVVFFPPVANVLAWGD